MFKFGLDVVSKRFVEEEERKQKSVEERKKRQEDIYFALGRLTENK